MIFTPVSDTEAYLPLCELCKCVWATTELRREVETVRGCYVCATYKQRQQHKRIERDEPTLYSHNCTCPAHSLFEERRCVRVSPPRTSFQPYCLCTLSFASCLRVLCTYCSHVPYPGTCKWWVPPTTTFNSTHPQMMCVVAAYMCVCTWRQT